MGARKGLSLLITRQELAVSLRAVKAEAMCQLHDSLALAGQASGLAVFYDLQVVFNRAQEDVAVA